MAALHTRKEKNPEKHKVIIKKAESDSKIDWYAKQLSRYRMKYRLMYMFCLFLMLIMSIRSV